MDDFLYFCDKVASYGWHEFNGGNVSKLLAEDEVVPLLAAYDAAAREAGNKPTPSDVRTLAKPVPGVANRFVLVTASGSHLCNISRDPSRYSGVIRVNEDGTAFQMVAGFCGGGKPTSEIICHLMVHALNMKKALVNKGEETAPASVQPSIVYHAHTPSLISLSHMIQPLTATSLTRELWSTFTECPLFCPEGVGTVSFFVPGSLELAEASLTQFQQFRAVLWSKHGLIVTDTSFDAVRGLAETLEKAAKIALNVRNATASAETKCLPAYAPERGASLLTKDDLRQMEEYYHLGLNPEILEGTWD